MAKGLLHGRRICGIDSYSLIQYAALNSGNRHGTAEPSAARMLDSQDPVDMWVLDGAHRPVRPAHLHPLHRMDRPQPEMRHRLHLAQIAAAGADRAPLGPSLAVQVTTAPRAGAPADVSGITRSQALSLG